MAPTVDLAEYLWIRLAELGLGSIHGVPGDYNLTVLDYLETVGIHWVGNANELNAGYAADGYARTKGIGALVTSFGVGELSAINALAGSYAEKVPVVHIVGTPPLSAQRVGACLHHSLGDGNFRAFADMHKHVTVAQANLTDEETAPSQIDAVLKACLRQSRPVYVEIPSDMVKVRVARPESVLDLSIPGYNNNLEDDVVDELVMRLQQSHKPMIYVDAFAAQLGANEGIHQLVKRTAIPTLTSPGGRGIVSEHLPNFHGVHFGSAADVPDHQLWAQSRDLVLRFGPMNSDANTFGFTTIPSPDVTVNFEKTFVEFNGTKTKEGSISIPSLLQKLLLRLQTLPRLPTPEPYPASISRSLSPRSLLKALPEPKNDAMVDQYAFWLLMSQFLQEGDLVLTEAGTSSYGGQSLLLPDHATMIVSTIWLSIGYTLAAAQGASLALRELEQEHIRPQGRVVLFEGEGSFQMTAQSISDTIRNKLDLTVFVLNNNGYTVERIIHGFHESYNDIQPWRYLEAPNYFGAAMNDPSYPVRTYPVRNWGELQTALRTPELQSGKGLQIVEVLMDMGDAPQSLVAFTKYLAKRNRGRFEMRNE